MAYPIQLSQMPSLSLLYKLHHVHPEDYASGGAYPPKDSFNDKICLVRNDITRLAVDAIVNAANESLLGGGGVDGAIHNAAGRGLLLECQKLDSCETGSAKITGAYDLPCKKVIHAVGPIYWATTAEGTHSQLLAGCYRTSLELAVANGCRSVAFPAISTGVYGYPSEEACVVALRTVRGFLDEGKGNELDKIIFCNFLQKDKEAYERYVPRFFPPAEPESNQKPDGKLGTTESATAAKEEKPIVNSPKDNDLASKLPDVPNTAPTNAEEPSTKKTKTEDTRYDTEDEDYVLVDRDEAKGISEAGVAPPKIDV